MSIWVLTRMPARIDGPGQRQFDPVEHAQPVHADTPGRVGHRRIHRRQADDRVPHDRQQRVEHQRHDRSAPRRARGSGSADPSNANEGTVRIVLAIAVAAADPSGLRYTSIPMRHRDRRSPAPATAPRPTHEGKNRPATAPAGSPRTTTTRPGSTSPSFGGRLRPCSRISHPNQGETSTFPHATASRYDESACAKTSFTSAIILRVTNDPCGNFELPPARAAVAVPAPRHQSACAARVLSCLPPPVRLSPPRTPLPRCSRGGRACRPGVGWPWCGRDRRAWRGVCDGPGR